VTHAIASLFEFESVDNCMLCGSPEQHDVGGVSWLGIAFSYCYCKRCGLKFMRPRPTAESYQRFYRDHFWQQKMHAEGFTTAEGFDDTQLDQLDYRMSKYKSVYGRLTRHLQKIFPLGSEHRVLEVGCGFGFSLEWLNRDYGCEVFGIEPSEESRQRCVKAKAIHMLAGAAEEYFIDQVPKDRFDVVLFRHCLENIVDPRSILTGVRDVLAPGGIVLVYTPNIEYFNSMNPYHPYIYSPSTLKRLLGQAGLGTFYVDTSPTLAERDAAVRLLNPSYEVACAARSAEPYDPEYPEFNAVKLAQSHDLGYKCRTWAELRLRDLGVRMAKRTLAQLTGQKK